MKISSKTQIAGLPAYRVRLALQRGKNGFMWPLCADDLLVSATEALAIADQLVAIRYLAPAQDLGTIKMYQRTALGAHFAKTAVPAPLPVADALGLLSRVIHHIQSLNGASELNYTITNIEVIGELLATGRETIPHLELAITLSSKGRTDDAAGKASAATHAAADAQGSQQVLLDRLGAFSESVCFRVKGGGQDQAGAVL